MREDEFSNRLCPPANFWGCTAFYSRHEVDKLIGVPPSYFGHKDSVTCPTVQESWERMKEMS